ncbi:Xanthine dehydrogenase family protein molybdopterin-binding subunit [Hyphomicrobiales bacterium]|nr:Xanthine dehydrogenase family protein molybdopterin-binding subunit [Hyphomicrobiales bacterium]CAH1677027.1 Xanthine dehydrogenase family protein molybdopterin-binding subunit [Hyphomicrobiales bacterium]
MNIVLDKRHELETPHAAPQIGRSVPRKEDDRLLQGGGRFVDDVSLPHQLEMAVLRCPFPHARISLLDTSAAAAHPGVFHVLSGADVQRLSQPITVLRPVPGAPKLPYYALAVDRALHEGQPIVSIVARSRAEAEDALELVEIEYEPLDHITDLARALEPTVPVLHPQLLANNLLAANVDSGGNAEQARAAADFVVQGRFRVNRVAPLSMETRGILVSWRKAARELDIRHSTQVPHLVRKQFAEILGIEESAIRVAASDVGGGYGMKLGVFPEDVLAALHAMALERPVKWIEDRMEYFRASTHGRESIHDMKIAAQADGALAAIELDYYNDIGAWNSPFGSSQLSSVVFTGPYRVADAQVRRNVVLTNKTPIGAYRGYGQPEVNFAREVLIDRLARQLDMNPVDLRRRNMLTSEELPWKTPSGAIYDPGDYPRALEMAVEAVSYDNHWKAPRTLRTDGRIVGIGFSSFVERTGYASARFLANRGSQFGAHESVTLRANRSGGVDLYTGVSTFGQGSETAFAQICAQVIGLDYESIHVHAGDTAASPLNTGAFASRTLIAGAGAVKKAGESFRRKMLIIAAVAMQCSPEDLTISGRVVHRIDDPSNFVLVVEVFKRAITGQGIPDGVDPGLEETAHFEPTDASFAFGTAAAVVAVDPESGEFAIERFVIVHDCGVPVNPMLVEGQVRGALVQGLGAALTEELRYDAVSGQLVNGSMMDYFAPMASDVPPIDMLHTEVPSAVTTYGIRGVGEIGTIPPAAAVANAICDALRDYGVELNDMPLTPERVWRALAQARSGSAAATEGA